MTVRRIMTCVGFVALVGTIFASSGQPLQALTMKECSAKYQAAKTAGTLNGQNWRDFRKAQCGTDATAAAPTAPPPAAGGAAAPSPAGNAVFPTAGSSKYSKESAGKGGPHTFLDQYKAKKATQPERGAGGGPER